MREPSNTGIGRAVRGLIRLEQVLSVVLLAVVFVTMAAQVVARYAFGSPFTWSEELARFAMIWLAFISAAHVMAQGQHITVDLISARLSRRGRLGVECFSSAAVLLSCLLLIVGGFPFVWRVAPVSSPALEIPMSWWYGAATVGLGLMALHTLLNLLESIRLGRPVWEQRDLDEDPVNLGGGGSP
jgi:TRAP-type transport system small permease protein